MFFMIQGECLLGKWTFPLYHEERRRCSHLFKIRGCSRNKLVIDETPPRNRCFHIPSTVVLLDEV